MFASHNHNQAKQPGVGRPERGGSTPDRKTAFQPNPLWQSLAMNSGILQPKLAISQTDDPYEREADRVADQVMRMPAPQPTGAGLSITPATAHQAQRKCAGCEEEEEEAKLHRKENGGAGTPATAPPIVHQTLNSPGRPLDRATRSYFEPRFGSDFSEVRIHTDARAVESARAVNALAYTSGRDIAFATGQYAPHTESGRRLIAHELAHVAQQGVGGSIDARGFHRRGDGLAVPSPGDPAEKDADSVAESISIKPSIRSSAHRLYRASDDGAMASDCNLEGSLSLRFQAGGSIVARYHTEPESSPAGIAFHWLALTQDVFNNPPLLPLLDEACGQWVRFDIGETPPDTGVCTQDTAEGEIFEFGVSASEDSCISPESAPDVEPADTGAFGTIWMRANPAMTAEAVADNLAFPKIMNLHRQKMASSTEPDVVTEFFSGLAEGLGSDFRSEVAELGRTFATIGPVSFLLQPAMLAGAVYEIYNQASDLAETAGALLADPEGAKKLVIAFFQSVFSNSAQVARGFGEAIGKDVRSKVSALVNAGKSEGGEAGSTAEGLVKTAKRASDFAFELGRIVGPIIFEIILDIVAPGAILLRTGSEALRVIFRSLQVLPDLGLGSRLGALGGGVLRQLVKARDFKVLGETLPHRLTLQLSGGKLVCAVCSPPPCAALLERIEEALKSTNLSEDARQTLIELQSKVRAHADKWEKLEESEARAVLDGFTKELEDSQQAAQRVVVGERSGDPQPDQQSLSGRAAIQVTPELEAGMRRILEELHGTLGDVSQNRSTTAILLAYDPEIKDLVLLVGSSRPGAVPKSVTIGAKNYGIELMDSPQTKSARSIINEKGNKKLIDYAQQNNRKYDEILAALDSDDTLERYEAQLFVYEAYNEIPSLHAESEAIYGALDRDLEPIAVMPYHDACEICRQFTQQFNVQILNR